MTLSEFLLARITDDEAWFSEHYYFGYMEATPRLLADCEAKRRIISRLLQYLAAVADKDVSDDFEALDILCDLASVYADHPDYLDEWRP